MNKAFIIALGLLLCSSNVKAEDISQVTTSEITAPAVQTQDFSQIPTSEIQTAPVKTGTGYVLIVIPQYNFIESEYSIPKVAISRAGFTVEVASTSTKEIALGADALKVRPNLSISQIDPARYDAILFVGGYMSKKFFEDKILIEKAKAFNETGKLIGAMDNVPYFMAQWGLLQDTKVTVNRSLVKAMKSMHMNYVDKDIVLDKNIITVNELVYSDPFATEFINELNRRTTAQ